MSSLDRLRTIMTRLRDPDAGCPWDLAQTWETIVPHTLEEAYEVADTIERGDFDALPGELGDLLFQVVFYCQFGREQGRFDFDDVAAGIADKLERRHPHVFADAAGLDQAAVSSNWERLKAEERRSRSATSELDDVPLALPALSRARKIQKRAARVGFDWPDSEGVWAKMAEETGELREAIASGDAAQVDEELGDLLFATVNLARHLGVEPESALRGATRKFEQRFRTLEAELDAAGKSVAACEPAELERLWQRAKLVERQKKTGADAPVNDQGEGRRP